MTDIKTKRKGYWLFKNGKVKKEIDTDKRIYFKVKGKTNEYSVIFDKNKNEFKCDCQFFSLKFTDCSHIIACKEFLNDQNAT